MINPLSLQYGQHIYGREINAWCLDQISRNGSHLADAKRLLSKHYRDDVEYELTLKPETGGGVKPHVILFRRVNREEKNKYD